MLLLLYFLPDAIEAVKQGGAIVGCKVFIGLFEKKLSLLKLSLETQSTDYVVLAAARRAVSNLSSAHQKLFSADEYIGVGISGLTADGTSTMKELRTNCISHGFTFNSNIQVNRLAGNIADKWQSISQRAGSRPSGIGLLIAGKDQTGCHLYQVCPSGNLYDHVASAIGTRFFCIFTALGVL